jgi:predicted RNase H-like HicB family nuclease
MVYAPVLGNTYEEAMKNADIALKGFKRIPLSDVIHAIGVESNFYSQVL